MNTLFETPERYRTVAFFNTDKGAELQPGEPALFSPLMELEEAPTAFLRERMVDNTRCGSAATWRAAAYALAGWLDFLRELDISNWAAATQEHLTQYRQVFTGAISPHTNSIYAPGTIANRMSTVLSFYDFASSKGWYHGSLGIGRSAHSTVTLPFDELPLAHLSGSQVRLRRSGILPKRKTKRTAIRPFHPTELRRLVETLGPRAAEKLPDDFRSSRNRLIIDLGYAVGLRVSEIRTLTRYQFLSMHPDPGAQGSHQGLFIVGKGGVERRVAVPNWLIFDVLAYIADERAAAIRASGKPNKDLPDLFLSSEAATRPGRPLSQRRFQQILEDACLKSGLTRVKSKTDINSGQITEILLPAHCFHDLRHTYATLTYWIRRQQGSPDPWKEIQAQLGHKFVATTKAIYVHFVELFEERGGAGDLRSLFRAPS